MHKIFRVARAARLSFAQEPSFRKGRIEARRTHGLEVLRIEGIRRLSGFGV